MKRLLTILLALALPTLTRAAPFAAGDLVVQRTAILQGVITPATITANQNDYNPTSLSIALRLRLSTDASRTVTGLAGGVDGLIRILHNTGSNPLVMTNEDAASTAANRFALGADVTLTSGTGLIVIYDGTSSRWRGLGTPGSGSGGGGGGSANWGQITGSLSSQADLSSALSAKAPIASPTFTGTPAAPTAAADTNTTQLATTGFVIGQSYLKTATAASTYQPLDSDLTAIAALATTSAGRGLLTISSLTAAGLGLTNGSTIDSWGTKTAPSGTVVGTSDSQSLLNKKLGSLTSNGFVKTSGGDGTLSVDTATYLTGNQTVTLSGDASGSGATSISVTVGKINGTSLAGLATGLLKNTTTTGIPSIAVSGTDYAPATSGSAILKGNGSGGFASATSGTDYAPATSGTAILKGNGTGGFASTSAGTDYEVPLTFTGGLTRATNSVSVNTTQNIAKLSNLTSNGFVVTSGGDGTLGIDTSTYLTTSSAASSYQPLDLDLTAIAALSTTSNGRGLLTISTLTAAGLGLTNGSTIDSWGAKTAPSGTVVGTSDSQSLLNKKLGSLTSNGFVKTGSGDGTLSVDTNTYITGNQTVTLSGDATGSGATSITVNVGKLNGVSLGGLATGIIKNTTSVGTPSIAVAGTDYLSPADIGTTVQAYDTDLTTYAGITPSANVQTLLGSADYAAFRTSLGLVIGTNVQAYDADLTTYAGITPSANVQTLLGASNFSAFRTSLGVAIGSDVQAYSSVLATYAGIAPSANVQTVLGAANYGAIRTALTLVPGTDVQAYSANLATLTTSTLGDLPYASAANTLAKLAGNTTSTRKFLRQTGTGTVSAAPVWDTLVAGDIPDISATYQPLDSDLTAIAALSTSTFGRSVLALGSANSSVFYTDGSGNVVVGATLPAVSGANLTSLNASNLSSGTVAAARGGAGTVNGILKANGSGTVSAASSGTDYAPATSGTAILKGNGSGGFSSTVAGTDYTIPSDVQIFTTPGSSTWTKPTNAKWVTVICVGGGGGGGAGRKGAAGSFRGGGGIGAGAAKTSTIIPASVAGSTETVTVGAGGTAGTSATSNDTDGGSGGNGASSSFGSHVLAQGATGGGGGSSSSGGSTGQSGQGDYNGSVTNNFLYGAAGGGTGGTITSGNVAGDGLAGGNAGTYVSSAPLAGGSAGASGGNGGAATNAPTNSPRGGAGGGGGGASRSGNAGTGAAGGLYGGGGGAGGAAENSVGNSGAGGKGGDGIVVVITTF